MYKSATIIWNVFCFCLVRKGRLLYLYFLFFFFSSFIEGYFSEKLLILESWTKKLDKKQGSQRLTGIKIQINMLHHTYKPGGSNNSRGSGDLSKELVICSLAATKQHCTLWNFVTKSEVRVTIPSHTLLYSTISHHFTPYHTILCHSLPILFMANV